MGFGRRISIGFCPTSSCLTVVNGSVDRLNQYSPDHRPNSQNIVFYGHSGKRQDRADWPPLKDHVENVALVAQASAAKFDAAEFGYVADLLHDLGKYSSEFQRERLEKQDGQRVDHSTAGAKIAAERYGSIGRLIAF